MKNRSFNLKNFVLKEKAITAFVVLFVLMCILNRNFLTAYNIRELLLAAVPNLLVSLGVTFTILVAGCDLSVGGVMCMAGIISIGLQQYMPMGVAILVAILAGAVVGFVNGFLVVHQKTEAFIITLGMGMLLKGINLQVTNAHPLGGRNMNYFELGNGSIIGIPYPLLIAIIMVVIFYLIQTRTAYGRNLYAIGGDYDVAVFSGISAEKQKWLAFVLCGVTAAIGGVLLSARLNTASAVYGDQTAMVVNCAAVIGGTSFIGGIGGVEKSAIGVLLFTLIETGLNQLGMNTYIQQAITGILIIVICGMDLYSIKVKTQAV